MVRKLTKERRQATADKHEKYRLRALKSAASRKLNKERKAQQERERQERERQERERQEREREEQERAHRERYVAVYFNIIAPPSTKTPALNIQFELINPVNGIASRMKRNALSSGLRYVIMKHSDLKKLVDDAGVMYITRPGMFGNSAHGAIYEFNVALGFHEDLAVNPHIRFNEWCKRRLIGMESGQEYLFIEFVRFVELAQLVIEANPQAPINQRVGSNLQQAAQLINSDGAYHIHNKYVGGYITHPYIISSQHEKIGKDTNSCGYDLLINKFKDTVIKQPKKLMTYTGLYEYFHGCPPNENSDWKLTVEQLKTFFKAHRISAVFYNRFEEKIDETITPKDNLNKNYKRTIYLLITNDHVYEEIYNLERKIKNSRDEVLTDEEKKLHTEQSKLSTRYMNETEETKKPADALANSWQEAMAILHRHSASPSADNLALLEELNQSEPFDKVDLSALNAGIDRDIEIKIGFPPFDLIEPLIRAGEIPYFHENGFNLYFEGHECKFSTTALTWGDINFESLEQYQEFNKLYLSTKRAIMPPCLKSTYSAHVKTLFSTYKQGGFIGLTQYGVDFLDTGATITNNPSVYAYDYNRYYTSILAEIEEVPIITALDDFESVDNADNTANVFKYNEHAYYLMNTEKPNILIGGDRVILYGKALIEAQKDHPELLEGATVKSVLTPQMTLNKSFSNVIKYVYEQDTTSDKRMAKLIINAVIGNMTKTKNNKSRMHIFSSACEMAYFAEREKLSGRRVFTFSVVPRADESACARPSDSVMDSVKTRGTPLYILESTQETDLIDGFINISNIIYTMARLRLYKVEKELRSKGATIYGYNTDCVYANKLFDCDNLNDPKSSIYENMGKIKIKETPAHSMPKNPVMFSKTSKEISEIIDTLQEEYIPPLMSTMKNEYDLEEFYETIKDGNICVLAQYPGSGKSYGFQQALNRFKPEEVLYACPVNPIAERLRDLGLNAQTIHHIAGIDTMGLSKTYKINKSVKYLILEEFGMFSPVLLGYVKGIKNTFPHIKICANGDNLYQMLPVETVYDCSKMEHTCQYYIDKLFGRVLMLNEVKCLADASPEYVRRWKRIFDLMKAAKDPEEGRAILIYKGIKEIKTIDEGLQKGINAFICAFNQSATFCTEQYKRANGDFIKEGSKVICRNGNQKYKIHPSAKYQIQKINMNAQGKHEITILNSLKKEVKIPIDQFKTFMSWEGSGTIFTYQGDRINGDFCVLESPTMRHLMTSISRCRRIENIHLYTGNEIKNFITDRAIEARIDLYMRADLLNNRNVKNFIDLKYVRSMMKVLNCVHCGCYLDSTNWGIDRISNDNGHVKGNCKLSCTHCNIRHINEM